MLFITKPKKKIITNYVEATMSTLLTSLTNLYVVYFTYILWVLSLNLKSKSKAYIFIMGNAFKEDNERGSTLYMRANFMIYYLIYQNKLAIGVNFKV